MSVAERLSSHKTACTSCSRTHLFSSSRVPSNTKFTRHLRLQVVRSDLRESDVSVTGTLATPSSCSKPVQEELVKTRYIAETLLPTRHGAFRLRGYKHSVSGGASGLRLSSCSRCLPLLHHVSVLTMICLLQLDGGITFTEPTAIICGNVEGQSNVGCPLGQKQQCCSQPCEGARDMLSSSVTLSRK